MYGPASVVLIRLSAGYLSYYFSYHPCFWLLVGRYSAHASGIYTHNTVPAGARKTPILFSVLFSARYKAIAAWHPDTRDERLQSRFLHTPTAVLH